MKRSIKRPMKRPIKISMIGQLTTASSEGGGVTPISPRYFTYLKLASQGNYPLTTPKTFTGTFSIDYASSTVGIAMDFGDGFGVSSGGLFTAPASVTDIELNSVSVGLGATAPLDGRLNTVKYIGVVAETITVLGQSGSSSRFFDGVLANAIIDDGGTLTTFKLDSSTATAVEANIEGGNSVTFTNINAVNQEQLSLDNGVWGGVDLTVNGNFDTDTGWTKGTGISIVGGVATFDGTQAGETKLTQTVPLIQGATYSSTFTLVSRFGGNFRVEIGGVFGTVRSGSPVTYNQFLFAGGDTVDNNVIRANTTGAGSVDSVSLNRIIEVA